MRILTAAGQNDSFPLILTQMGEEVITMAYVKVDENEPLEKSIKRFKRMVEKEGIIREWKKREYYEKPSTIQRTARTRLLRASR